VEVASSLSCEPLRGDQPTDTGAQAAIECTPDSNEVSQMTLLGFSDADELRDHWLAETGALEPALEETADACDGAQSGTRKWGFGNVACLIDQDTDTARILWTDRRNQTYGVVDGADTDISSLFAWWRSNARPLGRDADGSTPARVEPTPSKAPSLVRVPGPPRAIVCTDLSEPIVDQWGRTWRVKNVDFLENPKYERVVINLERTGTVRNGNETAVTVERMPVPQLKAAVPNAPIPRKGRTAIVVRMEGVKNAPNLLAYRPSSTDIIKELSIVKDGKSRTAVLGVTREACYQVRVPVFGSSATGKERKAEVYIDLKE